MDNKFLVKIYVPLLERNYEVWLPITKTIHNIVKLLVKAISEQTKGVYAPDHLPILYNKKTAEQYNYELSILDSGIHNGTELVLI